MLDDDAPKNRNRDKLILPTSELNQLQIQFIKGEIWPEKLIDLMRLSGTNPGCLFIGGLTFILGLLVGKDDPYFGVSLLFMSMFMIFCELFSSVQTSCVLSNYYVNLNDVELLDHIPVYQKPVLQMEEQKLTVGGI